MWSLPRFPPDPTARILIPLSSIPGVLVLPFCLYFLTACIVQLEHTFTIRLALLPITLTILYNTATGYSLADPELNTYNQALVLTMLIMAMRIIEWSSSRKPLKKRASFHGGTASGYSRGGDILGPFVGLAGRALDLCIAFRGVGWIQRRGREYKPTVQTKSTTSRAVFFCQTLLSMVVHFALFDVFHTTIKQFGTIGLPQGGSIYYPSLPPLPRFGLASMLGLFAGLCVYCMMQAGYDACTILFVTLVRQPIADWPPYFESVFSSTSLADFWGKRWHQTFRQTFIFFGGLPGEKLLGRPGSVMGCFVVSGLLHDWAMWGMGKGTDFPRVGGYFLLQGFGIIIEALVHSLTSKKVSGRLGQGWTAVWVIIPFQLVAEAWLTRGLAAMKTIPAAWSPARRLLQTALQAKLDGRFDMY